LQQEVKEIPTDGSVNALLQKLLRAEAVIQERTANQFKAYAGDSMSRRSTGSQSKKGSTDITVRPPTHNAGSQMMEVR